MVKNYGEIEKLSDWKKKIGVVKYKKTKNTESPDSRTRGPAAPTVLVSNVSN